MPSTLTLDGKFYFVLHPHCHQKYSGTYRALDIEQVICLTLTLANGPENLLSGEPVYQVWQLQESCQNTLSRNHLVYIQTDRQTNKCKKIFPHSSMGKGGCLKIYILIVIDGWTLNSNHIFLSIPSTLCVIGKRSLELFTNQKQFSSLDMTKLLTSTRWIPGSVNENSLYIRYQGIDPWWAKIRVIKEAFSPTDVPSRGLLSKQKTTFPSPRGEKQTPCESLKLLIYHLPTINQLYFLKTEFQFHVLHNINEIFFLLCHHFKKYWSIISITPWKRSYSLPQSKPLKVKKTL